MLIYKLTTCCIYTGYNGGGYCSFKFCTGFIVVLCTDNVMMYRSHLRAPKQEGIMKEEQEQAPDLGQTHTYRMQKYVYLYCRLLNLYKKVHICIYVLLS